MKSAKTVRLGDVCDVIAGQSPEGTNYTEDSSFTEFHQGAKAFGDKVLKPSGVFTKEETKIAPQGAILLSVRAPVGTLNLTDRRICIGRGLAALLPHESLDRNFLFLYLLSARASLEAAAGAGSVFASLSCKVLSSLEVPLPPLATQRAIVARLDSALARAEALEKRFAAIAQNAELSFKATLNEEFAERTSGTGETSGTGDSSCSRSSRRSSTARDSSDPSPQWPMVRLGDVCEVSLGKMLDKAKNHGEPHPYLRNVNVRWSGFDLADMREMLAEPQDLPKYSAIAGDLVACEGGEPGRCAIWRGKPILLQKALHRIRPGKQVLAKYLCHMFALYAQNGTFSAKFSGTTIKHLTGEAIASVEFSLPPLSVQRAIVSRLDAARKRADSIAALARQAAEAAANLRKALLKEAFE